MEKEIKGPIVNNAYDSEMRAIAIDNHICVDSIYSSNNTIKVYREKMFTITEKSNTITRESFDISNSETKRIKEMLQFIEYHFELAINTGELTIENLTCHKQAIEMLESELNKRKDLENTTYKYLLINMIKGKEYEIEQLNQKIDKLSKN
ncbi:MAG: hypothetical protein ACOYOT_05710 [Bacteroidales bacterium]